MNDPKAAQAETAKIPLRERNFARVRRSILEACLALTNERSFSQLSVREICDHAMVSQGTFFNYFPTKEDVLFYYTRIWSVRAALRARAERGRGQPVLRAIAAIFEFTAREMQAHPRLMLEVVSVIANAQNPPDVRLTRGDRLLWFADEPEAEDVNEVLIDELFGEYVEAAIEEGELPRGVSLRVATRALRAAFYGIPIATRADGVRVVARAYDETLAVLWAGLAALGRQKKA
jgi:AcrR family transcriptional regulator